MTLTHEAVGQMRTLLIAAGILGMVTGVLVLAWPAATVLVIAVVLGVNLVAGGIVSLVAGATAEGSGGDRILGIIVGLLSVLAGVVVFSRPVRSVALLVVVLGAFWVVSGVSEAVGGLAGRRDSRALALLSGLVSVGAGIVALSWPGVTLVSLVWITGIWMLVFGLIRLIMGVRLPKLVGA